MRTCSRVAIGISSRTSIARLYGSSPVEQPALQIVSGRLRAIDPRINSGKHMVAKRPNLRRVTEKMGLLDRDDVEQTLALH